MIIKKMLITVTSTLSLLSCAYGQVTYGIEGDSFQPVFARSGMVSSQEQHATEIGVNILKAGGNAIDAAAAIGFALAVTHPQAGNIGGGGFMLIHLNDGTQTSIDFRETAPKSATRNMYLDSNGAVIPNESLTTLAASGVPGTVAGLLYALDKYGTQSRSTILDPAVELAENGFTVSRNLGKTFSNYGVEVLSPHSSSRQIFFDNQGQILQEGDTLIQSDLAQTLTRIKINGADDFYKGETAQKIADHMLKGGLITIEDLNNYQVVEREPIKGTYHDYEIISMPPPSSGGIHIIQILNILENFDLKSMGANSAKSIHLMSEAMKYAYADRTEYLGDPDFTSVPISALTSKEYAKSIANQISLNKATPSSLIKEGDLTPYESDQTTHYSIVDQFGNAVAVTYTLNTNFGSGIVAEGTGILLNNEMDDFSSKPGVANVYGLIGGDKNAIEPLKRPLSSMSPTIISKDGDVFVVTGSPGGSRIITTVLQMILNTLTFEMNIAEATASPRIHHQWLPDYVRVEKGINIDTINLLKEMGHDVKIEPVMGSTQSIMKTEEGLFGATDTRSDGLSKGH